MTTLMVGKFGGTSLGSPANIAHCVELSRSHGLQVVVVSAMSGVTDLLLNTARAAARREEGLDLEGAGKLFADKHRQAIDVLLGNESEKLSLQAAVAAETTEFVEICTSLRTLGEETTRSLDLVVSRGERLIAKIFAAALAAAGKDCRFIEATDLIHVRRQHGDYVPDYDKSETVIVSQLKDLIAKGVVVVVPGFIGSGPGGEVRTLGRGGTDLSAAIIAASLSADGLILFKEVDGIMTADPKAVPDARIVPELSYREAAELAYYGAKILHPRTMIPLRRKSVALTIKNTFRPDAPGTRIAEDVGPGVFPVKAITAIKDQALVAIEGNGMQGVPGIAAKTFEALARAGISVSVISQASSEASICLVVPRAQACTAEEALREAFDLEIKSRLIDGVKVRQGVAIVAIVGQGMSGTPGIASRAFGSLAEAKVNILAIAQGSSELNISCALDESDVERALLALHRKFRLEKLKVIPLTADRRVSFFIFGFGQIGRTLADQFQAQRSYYKDKLGATFDCIGLADSSGIVSSARGYTSDELATFISAKTNGHKLKTDAGSRRSLSQLATDLSKSLFEMHLDRGVFVDCTAEETADLIEKSLSHGLHVVLANKKPLTGSMASFRRIMATAKAANLQVRYEATVGAGLPILDTLAKLADTGDRVLSIDGCLSGTLGFLMSELEAGQPFSVAVKKAYDLGYTEPDPRDDLSGIDVGRKAIILARTLGIEVDMQDLNVESLFTPETSDGDPQIFLENIRALDEEWQSRIESAHQRGNVLRYVATVEADRVAVGIKEVAKASPLGRLAGADNQVSIRSLRYQNNPLIVTGPGAGAAVTAAGVLSDVIAIAAMDGSP